MPNKKHQDLVDISFDLDSFTIFDDRPITKYDLLLPDKEYPRVLAAQVLGQPVPAPTT